MRQQNQRLSYSNLLNTPVFCAQHYPFLQEYPCTSNTICVHSRPSHTSAPHHHASHRVSATVECTHSTPSLWSTTWSTRNTLASVSRTNNTYNCPARPQKMLCQRCNALISHTLQLAKIIRARTNCPLHCLRGQTRPRLLDPAATPLAVLQSFARRCAHMASSVQHGYTSQRMSTQRGAHAKTLGATCGSRLGLRAPRCCPGLRAPRPCGRHTCISCAWARESARASR